MTKRILKKSIILAFILVIISIGQSYGVTVANITPDIEKNLGLNSFWLTVQNSSYYTDPNEQGLLQGVVDSLNKKGITNWNNWTLETFKQYVLKHLGIKDETKVTDSKNKALIDNLNKEIEAESSNKNGETPSGGGSDTSKDKGTGDGTDTSKDKDSGEDTYEFPSFGELKEEVDDWLDRGAAGLDGTNKQTITTQDAINAFLPVGRVLVGIATIVLVVVGLIFGVKYMIAGANDKAQLKQKLIYYVISIVLVYGAVGIFTIIVNVMNAITK